MVSHRKAARLITNNPKILDRLRREASKSPSRHRHAACLLSATGEWVAGGHNRGSRHAEVDCVVNWWRSRGARGKGVSFMLVARVAPGGSLSFSEPCLKCRKFLAAIDVPVFHT